MPSSSDELTVDPMFDEEAEQIINPRPSSKHFSSLAEREAAHALLFHEGVRANTMGDLELAVAKFGEAYSLLFRTATLRSLVNMKLKLGEAELAAACYAKMLRDEMVSSPAEVQRVQLKLAEAKQLHADVSEQTLNTHLLYLSRATYRLHLRRANNTRVLTSLGPCECI